MARQFAPQVQETLDAIARIGAEHPIFSVQGAREFYQALNPLAGPPEPVARVDQREIEGPAGAIPVRIYYAVPDRMATDRLLPAVLYFHGGWFFVGGLDTHDVLTRAIANAAGCAVISVDYRLAPEHPFPAASHDCLAALEWVVENATEVGIDPTKIAIAGDSAGGALAGVLARQVRDQGGPNLSLQALIYPVIKSSFDSGSWQEFADGPVITHAQAVLARQLYVPDHDDWESPDALPGYATDLQGLPPAWILTAECDPLHDEGNAYAAGLQNAGVPTKLSQYPGMIHGFLQMTGMIDAGRKAIEELAAALVQAWQNAA